MFLISENQPTRTVALLSSRFSGSILVSKGGSILVSGHIPRVYRYCGKEWTAEDIERIRELIASHAQASRYRLSRLVSEAFEWRAPNLGYKMLPGAQIRYLILDLGRVLGAMGFGAAAWKVAPRDQFVGWTPAERERGLHLIVGQSRFLILPWIHCRNLASKTLALAAARLPEDWQHRYGFQPALLETFVPACQGRGQGHGAILRHLL